MKRVLVLLGGMEVHTVARARKAAELIRENPGAYDLIILSGARTERTMRWSEAEIARQELERSGALDSQKVVKDVLALDTVQNLENAWDIAAARFPGEEIIWEVIAQAPQQALRIKIMASRILGSVPVVHGVRERIGPLKAVYSWILVGYQQLDRRGRFLPFVWLVRRRRSYPLSQEEVAMLTVANKGEILEGNQA